MRVTILTQQISHYHAARYRAARQAFSEFSIVSVMNSADFPEFLAHGGDQAGVEFICRGESDYSAAVADGSLLGRMTKALAAQSPDVVAVAGWSFPESLATIAWARDHDRGVIMMSDSQVHDGPRSGWREWVKSRVVRACDAGLVAADNHRAYVASLGLPSEVVFLGYDAVDNDYFQRGSDEVRQSAENFRTTLQLPSRYLLASGRFIPKKNFPRLTAAFARALQMCDLGHDLVILGNGPERQAIEKAIAQHGMERRVHLPGFRDYASLPAFYGLADGFVHVSLAEQWGLVINEAAAAQLPLIVSQPCGAANILVQPEENGWRVHPEETESIAHAISEMMRLTPSRRREMGEASLRIVRDWGPERFAAGLMQAAEVASQAVPRKLALADQLLFRIIARFKVSKVA